MKIVELLTEIDRIPQYTFTGGKDELEPSSWEKINAKTIKPLPGGSGLNYSVQKIDKNLTIRIWDPNNKQHYEELGTIIGELRLFSRAKNFPIKNTYEVAMITVDEDYRGQSIAKSLYGIALNILNVNLVTSDYQTPGGRRNWVSLSKIPGVEVMGWIKIQNYQADNQPKIFNTLLGKLGAFNVGDVKGNWQQGHIFMFEVKANDSSTELMSNVKSELSKIYDNSEFMTGLFAHWVG